MNVIPMKGLSKPFNKNESRNGSGAIASAEKYEKSYKLLDEAEISNRAVVRACKVSNRIVEEFLERAEKAGLIWPLPEDLSDEDLCPRMIPEKEKAQKENRLLAFVIFISVFR